MSLKNRLKNGPFRFRCTNRKCSVNVVVNSTPNVLNNDGSHRSSIKIKSKDDSRVRPSKLMRQEIQTGGPSHFK